MDEIILVVPRKKIFNNEKYVFQGALIKNIENTNKSEAIINNIQNNYIAMRRGDAEENSSYKQVIPYAVIRQGDNILLYKRLSGGGEARLHDKLSIGIGGHMNTKGDFKSDGMVNFYDILSENLERELNEELKISNRERDIEIIGLINDDSDKVGEVHVAILVVIDLNEYARVEIREKEQLEGSFVSVHELLSPETFNRLENWSQIAVKALLGG